MLFLKIRPKKKDRLYFVAEIDHKTYDQFKVNEVSNPRIENLLATQAFDSITESLSSDGIGRFVT